jgi:hypothetical protein
VKLPSTGTAGVVGLAAVACALGLSAVVADIRDRTRTSAILREIAQVRAELAALSDRTTQREPVVCAAPPAPAAPAPAPALAVAASPAAIADGVVQALDERERAHGVASAPAPPSAEAVAAREAARRTLANAVSRGTLTPDDVEAIRKSIGSDADARFEIASAILAAVNKGQLKLQDRRTMIP